MAVARLALTSFADGEVRLSDEVELYQRTYTTLLRSSGETRCACSSPRTWAMGSSLHPLAASEELDLGAFLYAIQRLPDGIAGAELVIMGQDVEALTAVGIPVESWQEAEAPARRRRWYDSGPARSRCCSRAPRTSTTWSRRSSRSRSSGTRSASACARPAGRRRRATRRPARGVRARARGQRRRLGPPSHGVGHGVRRADAADRASGAGAASPHARRHPHRLCPPDTALVGAGERQARRAPGSPSARCTSSARTPTASSNIVTGIAREREPELIEFVEQLDDDDILRQELTAFREGESQGSWENFLYFVARLYFAERGPDGRGRAPRRRAAPGRHASPKQDRAAGARPGHLARRARSRCARSTDRRRWTPSAWPPATR